MGSAAAGGTQGRAPRSPFSWADVFIDAARAGITPDEVRAGTLRDLSIRLRGAIWRQEQDVRLAIRQAWHTAALVSYPLARKRLPSLKSILREPRKRVERQTPEEQRQFFHEFARRAGLKIERLDKPMGTVSNG